MRIISRVRAVKTWAFLHFSAPKDKIPRHYDTSAHSLTATAHRRFGGQGFPTNSLSLPLCTKICNRQNHAILSDCKTSHASEDRDRERDGILSLIRLGFAFPSIPVNPWFEPYLHGLFGGFKSIDTFPNFRNGHAQPP